MTKKCYIIAGPNGSGKSTFALDFLPNEGECFNFINADLIASGLSPFLPDNVKVLAGKLMLQAIDQSVTNQQSFAFETTLSGLSYSKKVTYWQSLGYFVELYYFSLPSVEMAINRVKTRVEQGGHDIPQQDIIRRFHRSKENLETRFKPIVNAWAIYDTASSEPVLLDSSYQSDKGLTAAKRAADKVISRAQLENRSIPIWKHGRIVFEVPKRES